MAFKTDTWKLNSPNATTDWGASSANWSTGFPGSNNDVVINTAAVQTIIYSSIDNATVHSLTVGNDVFEMTGGGLVITKNASFANGFTQTSGTLQAGGTVTVKGAAALTGGNTEGTTKLVFAGTVTLGSYTLGGATSLSNSKTTNLTNGINLGDANGVNATINNLKGGVFNIGGDFGINGQATAQFKNAGTFEKTGGTNNSFINVNFADTGAIIVTSGTLYFDGSFTDSFTGAKISGGGQFYLGSQSHDAINHGTTISVQTFTIADGSTVVTLNENLAFGHTFNLQGGAVLALAGATQLSLTGTDNFGNSAVLDGSGILATTKGAVSVNFFTLGGSVVWQNSTTVGEAGTFTLGDSTANAATFINEKGAKYQFTNDSGINVGASFGSQFINQGSLQKIAGSGTSIITAEVSDTGTIAVQSGTISFNGFENSFNGAISGAGAFAIGGGLNFLDAGKTGTAISTTVFDIANATVTLKDPLLYKGTFNFGNSATLDLAGFTMTLSGSSSFSFSTIDGTGTLVTPKGSSVGLGALTLGGAVQWQNSGTISETNALTIGDASPEQAKFINEKGGKLNFTTDVGIFVGANPASSFTNSVGASLAKTGGSGDSQIFVDFINNGKVTVATGAIEFKAIVSGKGSFTIDPGTVLQFDSSVAKTASIDFLTKVGGTLSLVDSQGFAAIIHGFGGTNTDRIDLHDINFNSGAFNMTYHPKGKTGGVLTATDGSHTAVLNFFGKYTLGNFHASSDGGSGTLLVDPHSHATLLASAR